MAHSCKTFPPLPRMSPYSRPHREPGERSNISHMSVLLLVDFPSSHDTKGVISCCEYDPRAPERISSCELEADGLAEDVLNRGECPRTPLKSAPPEIRMVESLGLMWEEERGRCGGRNPPPPPPDPPRAPRSLCHAVDHVRAQFQVLCRGTTPLGAHLFPKQ